MPDSAEASPFDGLSRRGFLAGHAGVAGVALAAGATSSAVAAGERAEDKHGDKVTPDQALKWLKQGNRRWVKRDIKRVDHTPPYRDITKGQWPIASILSCADSRVNPENIFDVAQGNLFNVRNAGNVRGSISIGSVEYSIGVLRAPLLVVLGHSGCGAVKAAQRALRTGEMPGGDIDAVVEAILPAIEGLPADQTLEQGIWANAGHSARLLRRTSEIIATRIRSRKLRLVVGVYDIGTREVTFA
ncbi:MAG: carbonic anhydrase [bacterium]